MREGVAYARERRAAQAARDAGQPEPPITMMNPGQRFGVDVRRRNALAVMMPSADTFRETFVRFLSNSLPVSTNRADVAGLAVPYEDEAIRAHVGKRFEDVLLASAFHPAMLSYLDAAASVGPTSRAGLNNRRGLNENYAREVMELHTLGVNGGYTQNDVRELAMALTGFGADRDAGTVGFRPERHEPGYRTFMGREWDQPPALQGPAMLSHIANHPVTARRFCGRLAAHYLGVSPPPAVTEAMVAKWTATRGSLPDVCDVLLGRDEAWNPAPLRFRTPDEFVLAAARRLTLDPEVPRVRDALTSYLRRLTQIPFEATSPQGYPADPLRWMSPEGLMDRASVAAEMAAIRLSLGGPLDPRELAVAAGLGEESRRVVGGAPSVRDGIALVLLSPEFQWR